MALPQDMPLQPELGLVNYLRSITGAGGSGNVATPGVAKEIDASGLSSIMTDWLRGNGQFLQNMQQQNQAGLYNSSTRRLVANDLTAQAALKAAGANQATRISNADNATRTSLQNAKEGVANQTGKSQMANLALAALLNAYNGANKPQAGGSKTQQGKQAQRQRAQDEVSGDATAYTPPEVFQNTADPYSMQVTPGNSDYTAMLAPDYLTNAFDTGLGFNGPADFSDFSSSINTNPYGSADGFNLGAFTSANTSIYNPAEFNLGSGGSVEQFTLPEIPSFDTAPLDNQSFDYGNLPVYDYGTDYGTDWATDSGTDYQDYSADLSGFDEWSWG